MGRKKGRRKAPFKLQLKRDTILSIISIVLWLAAGLIIVSFSGQGVILARLQSLLQDKFGFATLLAPFILISGGLMVSQVKWRAAKPNVFLGGLLLFVSVVGLFQAGSVGTQIFGNLAVMIHSIGAGLLFFGLGVIGLMIISETAIDEMLNLLIKPFTILSFKRPKLATGSDPVPAGEMKIKGADRQLELDDAPETDTSSASKNSSADSSKSGKTQPEATGSQTILTNAQAGKARVWENPPLSLLSASTGAKADRGDLKKNAGIIESVLESFGIKARVVEVNCGPAVTQYALEISLGTKLSKITALQNDLALALAAPTGQIRIEAPIPGRSMVGIEIPNRSPEMVTLKGMLSSSALKDHKSKLAVALGLDVSGSAIVADIASMPHVLIAGSTGSGKSVALNAFLASMLFRTSPDEVKFILVDPKRVELTGYNGIPHLLSPVIVEPDKVLAALKWAVTEMNQRYKTFAEVGVRNIEGFNELSGFQAAPYIVIVIDELADIMLFAPKEVEENITKLAQMARATGIHLVLATQRPSVDVLTGLIKANIPSRIAFSVSSMVDSRVIIDGPGAEKLLGRGDMLYIPPTQSKPTRIQGTYVSDQEIRDMIDYLKDMGVEPDYTEAVTTRFTPDVVTGSGGAVIEDADDKFREAVEVVVKNKRASASLLQRMLSIGYARAARILDQLEEAGVVSASDGSSKPRDVLISSPDQVFQDPK